MAHREPNPNRYFTRSLRFPPSLQRVKLGLTGGLIVLVCLISGAFAQASVKVAGDAKDPTLRVARNGVAEVGWTTQSGVRRHALIYRNGTIRWGSRLKSRDVSRPAPGVTLPLAAVSVRQTPNGRLWGLQSWRRLRTGPVELTFSCWRGAPTELTLSSACCKWRTETIQGRASFHGKPVHGFSATLQGVPLDPYGRNGVPSVLWSYVFRLGRPR